jgi:septum formation inhibitor MinC
VFNLTDQPYKTRQPLTLLVDVSQASNSSRAFQILDEFIAQLPTDGAPISVDLNAGNLLLTKGILLKIKQQLQRAGAAMGTVYSSVPQTQQAALDEGLYVKGKLQSQWTPLRQPLPLQIENKPVAPPMEATPNSSVKSLDVDLPNFASKPVKSVSSAVSAPEALEVPPPEKESVVNTTPPLVEPLVTEKVTPEPAHVELELPETAFETLYLRQTLRSGQTVRFDGHIVIVGDVHAGSEITAGGDIVVWGELRGIAHAGAKGNFKSEIRAMKIEALQLRIADYIARRPDRIYYHKDGAENMVSPETARVADGEIKIFKTASRN